MKMISFDLMMIGIGHNKKITFNYIRETYVLTLVSRKVYINIKEINNINYIFIKKSCNRNYSKPEDRFC